MLHPHPGGNPRAGPCLAGASHSPSAHHHTFVSLSLCPLNSALLQFKIRPHLHMRIFPHAINASLCPQRLTAGKGELCVRHLCYMHMKCIGLLDPKAIWSRPPGCVCAYVRTVYRCTHRSQRERNRAGLPSEQTDGLGGRERSEGAGAGAGAGILTNSASEQSSC